METLLLPLVSIVVVNYNYKEFLSRAVDSALAQTYPNVEVIIVDDKSTDDSCVEIDRICAANPTVKAVKLKHNGGQSLASFRGMAESSGVFVIFFDADDQMLSQCVEAHVYAHLSSRIPVAFTTVDILNNVDGQDVNMSHPGFSDYIASEVGRRPSAVRRVDQSMTDSWFGQRKPVISSEQMHFVLPPHSDPWVWSPTSANCFRSDAVRLLLREPGLERIRWGTDAFIIRPLGGLFGSILLDKPLVRYVIHKTNKFVKSAPLYNRDFFDSRSTADDMRVMVRTGIERLMLDVGSDGLRYTEPKVFFKALKTLTEGFPGPKNGERPEEYYFQQVRQNGASLTTAFGPHAVEEEIRKEGRSWQRQLLLRIKRLSGQF